MFNIDVYRFEECPGEAFRFRYQVYAEEMGRSNAYTDHVARTIIEPMDRTAYHGVANYGEEVAAVIRLNFVADGNVDPYFDFYEIGALPPAEQAKACICTRSMVAAQHRRTPLAFRMLKTMYVLAIENGSTACYIDVNAPLMDFYQRIGCKPLFQKEHPDFGLVAVMRLDGLDLDHLTAIRSPFAPICRKFLAKTGRLIAAE